MTVHETEAPRFLSLIPKSGVRATSLTADEALSHWRRENEDQQRLALNMIASVDGRIAVAGRSAPLGGPADRALFHALRARADAVVVAAGTVRSEHYGPIIRDLDVRDRRERQGLPAHGMLDERELVHLRCAERLAQPGGHAPPLRHVPARRPGPQRPCLGGIQRAEMARLKRPVLVFPVQIRVQERVI